MTWFFVFERSLRARSKGSVKNKKHGPQSGPVFFLTLFGRDSAKLIPAFIRRNSTEPIHAKIELTFVFTVWV